MNRRRYFKQVRIAQFRAMMELSRGKGFAAAAAALDLATPSVWQQVRALEDEFGVTLVEVNGQQVSLTEHGRLLVQLAAPVVEGFDAIVERFSQESKSIPKRLVIASPSNILVNELPTPILQYRKGHDEVELNLIDVPSNQAKQLLEAGEVDLAVVGQLASDLPSTLVSDSITTFPFMLVAPAEHPVMSIKRLTPKTLARFPLVMSSVGTNSRTRVDEVFSKAGLLDDLHVSCETSTKDLLLQYLQIGFGIAIVPISPRYRAKKDSPYGDIRTLGFRDVSKLFGHEEIVILRRQHRREPEYQLAFRETVLSSIE